MALVYVTGISGAGKSTVCAELTARGHWAHGVDEDGFRSWYDLAGTLAHDQRAWADADLEWRMRYQLRIERAKVEQLADLARAHGATVFLCGVTPNDDEVWDLFDLVIHLSVGQTTLRHRLETRTINDYGKHPQDLEDILGWNSVADKRMTGFGATLVNAERPLPDVVDEILEVTAVRLRQ
jgi:AAA domain